MEFTPMPKVPRLSREIVVTEKIDGTNASVWIGRAVDYVTALGGAEPKNIARISRKGEPDWVSGLDDYLVLAGSRTRWITPEDDNFGFARWVRENAEELAKLGPGHHFGEWWGRGIQRGYGLEERRFSLFNVGRWMDAHGTFRVGGAGDFAPSCCHVVPVLARVPVFETQFVSMVLLEMDRQGSYAAPGFMDPEGVMVYHAAANQLFKKTLKGDEEGKHAEAHPRKERPAKPPRDPSKGGRRKADVPFAGPDRRKK